jgi:hypothetical protein
MSPFHFCLSAAKNLSSFQLLPASLITDLLQLFLGIPLFLFPWGFQSRAAFVNFPSSFLNVWPIHLNFLFLVSKFIPYCPVTFRRSLLEIIFGYHILDIYLRHLFTPYKNDTLKICKISGPVFLVFRSAILSEGLHCRWSFSQSASHWGHPYSIPDTDKHPYADGHKPVSPTVADTEVQQADSQWFRLQSPEFRAECVRLLVTHCDKWLNI